MPDIDPNTHWRDSARPVKFFVWDGRAVFPLLLLLFFPNLWTLIFCVVLITFFSILNRFGFTPLIFFRWLRSTLAGPHKTARPWWMT